MPLTLKEMMAAAQAAVESLITNEMGQEPTRQARAVDNRRISHERKLSVAFSSSAVLRVG